MQVKTFPVVAIVCGWDVVPLLPTFLPGAKFMTIEDTVLFSKLVFPLLAVLTLNSGCERASEDADDVPGTEVTPQNSPAENVEVDEQSVKKAPAKKAEGVTKTNKSEETKTVGEPWTIADAHDSCRQILVHGIMFEYDDEAPEEVTQALKRAVCAQETSALRTEARIKSVVLPMAGLVVPDDASDLESDETIKSWRSKNCADDAASLPSFEEVARSHIRDENVVAEWDLCVLRNTPGLLCEASASNGEINLLVTWKSSRPHDASPKPSFRLVEKYLENIEAYRGDEKKLYAPFISGEAVEIDARHLDYGKPARFEFRGKDDLTGEELSCHLDFEAFATGTGPACGIERHETLRSEACGVEEYNTEASLLCPGSRAEKFEVIETVQPGTCEDAPVPAACPVGSINLGYSFVGEQCIAADGSSVVRAKISKRTCKFPEVLNSCALPEFGVKRYRECASVNHPVEAYKTCAHPDFWVLGDAENSR